MSNPVFYDLYNHQYRFLYLIKDSFRESYKFGICKDFTKRLFSYLYHDYEVKYINGERTITQKKDIEVIRLYEGDNVIDLEKRILYPILKGKRLKGKLEHYSMYDIETHTKVLEVFDSLKCIETIGYIESCCIGQSPFITPEKEI